MRLLTILVTALCLMPVVATADVANDLVAPYLRVQTALANDSTATIKADADQIAAEAARLGEPGEAMKAAATELANAADVHKARAAFGRLSDALVKYSEGEHAPLGADLNVAYCPMVKKSWVQKGSTVANPYGGKSMQSCGQVTKAIK